MSRLFYTYEHVGLATRSRNGTATAGITCGEFIDGQLIVRCTGLGVGGKLTPYWQSSAGGTFWGDLLRGACVGAGAAATCGAATRPSTRVTRRPMRRCRTGISSKRGQC